MKVKKLLGLLHLVMEEGDRAQFEISLHHINFTKRKEQRLSYCHTLNGEEALVQSIDSVAAKLEAIVNIDTVMYQGSCVNNRIFTTEVLHNTFAL